MAQIIDSYTTEDGHLINVYASGAEYDTTAKRLVRPAAHTVINPENATEYNRRRQELAREAFVQGATEATAEKFPEMLVSGDLGYVRAVGYVTQQKAMTAKDPKQPEAAKLVLNVGERIGDTKTIETTQTRVNVLVLPENVARLFADLKSRLHSETDISASNILDLENGKPGTQTQLQDGSR